MRLHKHVVLLAAVGLFVLVGATLATPPQPQTSDVSAAFTANQTQMTTRSCEVDGNTFRITRATWRGTSTSMEPRLSGTLVVRMRTVLNETTGDGWASGTWRTISDAVGRPRLRAKSNARLSAVIDNGNHLDGLATGIARRPYGRLLGNWSATIVGSTLSGELGANTSIAADNSALIYRGNCP
jgi:hypothetical protein